MNSTATTAPTWQGMIAIEPELAEIIAEAESIANPWWRDYEAYKHQLSQLVGHGAADERLASSSCYEIAIDRLTDALGLMDDFDGKGDA